MRRDRMSEADLVRAAWDGRIVVATHGTLVEQTHDELENELFRREGYLCGLLDHDAEDG